MPTFHFKRLNDPVHGTFGLSKLETDIISTRIFQRLHNVKQLGLAHLVFPGANYSRFAHSLGACHIAGRMLRAIGQNCKKTWKEEEIQLYRLAALLHDIGHYPFSHAMEHSIDNYYKGKIFLGEDENYAEESSLNHEQLGRKIIEFDPELGEVLERHNFSREDIKAVFSRQRPGNLSNLVSSDLDCDRLDYLARTAHAAGLPYGVVDIDYIVSQTCVDSQGLLCLTGKALRAADHMLVSRYFDYTQVAFHKTVVGFELALQRTLKSLLEREVLDCSASAMVNKIKNNEFGEFDDGFVIESLRKVLPELNQDDEPFATRIRSILNRRGPKLIAASERVDEADRKKEHTYRVSQLKNWVPEAAKKFGVPENLWYVWDRSLSLAKIGSRIPFSDLEARGFDEEVEQAVRILQGEPDAVGSTSRPLIDLDPALMKTLSNFKWYALRLYVHLEGQYAKLRSDIEAQLRKDIAFLN